LNKRTGWRGKVLSSTDLYEKNARGEVRSQKKRERGAKRGQGKEVIRLVGKRFLTTVRLKMKKREVLVP